MKNKINCLLCGGIVIALSLLVFFYRGSGYSYSERRELKRFPEATAESVFSGAFASGFEEYSTDNFPFRDTFRSIKAYTEYGVFQKSDNNKVIYEDGHLSSIEYPINKDVLDYQTGRLGFVYERFFKNTDANIYLSIVPDKNMFLDTLKIDYDELADYVKAKMPYAKYLDVYPLLSIDDYYRTDSHWRQEKIGDIAQFYAKSMGTEIDKKYDVEIRDDSFFGVYSGQSAIKTAPDAIKYLTNDTINSFVVSRLNEKTGMLEPSVVYDEEKGKGKDPYEFFLSGNSTLITIENPKATEKRELVVFRDSYSSSLAPILATGYSKVTLVDIRYLTPDFLGAYVDVNSADDVIFLYSSTLLNSAIAFK